MKAMVVIEIVVRRPANECVASIAARLLNTA
jgi:hypothetical protein